MDRYQTIYYQREEPDQIMRQEAVLLKKAVIAHSIDKSALEGGDGYYGEEEGSQGGVDIGDIVNATIFTVVKAFGEHEGQHRNESL